ncbi:LysM peptidoglycan-binding domain-containing protein [Nostoc spongiaeforme FACHB-130]|uniref:LysM peptidoglycan-binding domain-containing protein n=1 Tax=Nostoc spongiaeforme FACHB-130 TaxID=1357510 RepID=A0ABR8FQT2_9NOSO|nr:LysM peptidoglycan-binding domain-containing protein [Nostoc spongiaeforme]MBD2593201.1 LysM peptidoglycan-binding domain-containing protein [Nostoc spongiaeforme FACHB-130]
MSLFGFAGKKGQKAKKSKKSKPREIWQGKSFALDDIITPSVLVGGGENSPDPSLVDLYAVPGSEFDLIQSDLLQALDPNSLDLLNQPHTSLLNHQIMNDWLVDPSSQSLPFFDSPGVSANSLTESIQTFDTANACPTGDKILPGDSNFPGGKAPVVSQTHVDTGGNNLVNPTSIIRSAIQDVIDQVSDIDPIDIYRVNINDLKNADISVLSGEISVNYLMPSGQFLGSQIFSKGNYTLQPPAGITDDVIVKIDYQGDTPGTYILNGFESKAAEPFNINLEFEGNLTASQQAIIQAAAKSIESMITQGLPTAIVDGKLIDDVNFKISTINLDGEGGTAARTKIDFMRFGTMLPAQSITQFDAADIAELERSGELFSVVQHELLHGLGFGNLWEAKGLVDYAGTPLAQYNGKEAVKAFNELGGLTDHIALENQGDGSAGLHWNESLFQDEVMTADYNNAQGGNAPISLVTIASLADLGYQVNLNRATPNFGLFGGQKFKPEDLTPEQIEAFRELAETSFGNPDEEFIYATMPEVDPDTVAPEIWAHAERFWRNGQYYDWQRYQIKSGDTLSGIAQKTLGNAGYDYYMWIANHNGIPNPNYIVAGNWIEIPVYHPNYEWEQEQERLRREAELRQRQEEEARIRQQQEEQFQREQERIRQEEEARRREAEAKQRELEEQERRLREEMERRRQEEERIREMERQAEIARQQGKGGLDWFIAKSLPEFGPVDPFETKLTGETVGNLVPDDYYRFTLSRPGRIDARLMRLLADADLVLYDARNRPISYSMRDGITDEQIVADLIPGTYMLRVNSPKGVTTDYDLIVKFKHKLSQTEIGPPPGWQVGGGKSGNSSNSSGSGSISSGVTFADPRIKRIYDTALNNFVIPERAKANTQIQQLVREKQSYEQELQQLLDQMNGEQRAKVHRALDGIRDERRAWVDSAANPIKNGIDSTADWIINQIESKIPSQAYSISWFGDQLRSAKDSFKGAVNGARSWLKAKVDWVQTGVKDAIWQFTEALKNAYRTGAEINSSIETAAQKLKEKIDSLVGNINNWVSEFKGKILGSIQWLRNVGVNIPEVKIFGKTITSGFKWNFYDGVVEPLANSLANGIKSSVTSVGDFAKGTVDWIKPRAQKAVAAIVDAIFGDKTGHLYNKIHNVDQQIEATKTGLERAIASVGQKILSIARQIEALLTDPEERKRVLDALWQWGFKTAEEAYNFVVKKRDEVRKQIEAEKEARQKIEEEARRKAEEEARRKAEEEAWLEEKIQLSPTQEQLFKQVILRGNSQLIGDYNFLKSIAKQNIRELSSFSGVDLPESEILGQEFLNEPGSIFRRFSYMQVLQNKLGMISLEKAYDAYERIGDAINSYSFNDPALEQMISANTNKIVQQNYDELHEITEKYKSLYSFNIVNSLKDSANGIFRAVGLGLHFSRILVEIKTLPGTSLVKSAYDSLGDGSSGYSGNSVGLDEKFKMGKAIYDARFDIQDALDALFKGDFNKMSEKLLHVLSIAKDIEGVSKSAATGNIAAASAFIKLTENAEEFINLNSLLNNLKQIQGTHMNSDDISFVDWSRTYSSVSTLVSVVKFMSVLVSHISNGLSSTQIANFKTDKMTGYLDTASNILESAKDAIWNIFQELNATDIRNQNAIYSYATEYNHSAIKVAQKVVSYVAQEASSKL